MDTDPRAVITCYRHPDRTTRLACSDCGRFICAECSQDAIVGQKCPECARPAAPTRVIRPTAITHTDRRTTPLTLILIALNVVIYLVGEIFPDFGTTLFREGSQFRPLVARGEWWRAVTAMFLHADLMHVAFNMWALWVFGPSIERRYGTLPFASLYLAAGIAGGAFFHLVGRTGPAVGASGAIFGLFGALLAATYRQRHTRAGQAVFSQLLLLLSLNLALPFFVDGIAWEAHTGGLVIGIALAALWDRLPAGRPGLPKRTTAGAVIAVAALLLVILV